MQQKETDPKTFLTSEKEKILEIEIQNVHQQWAMDTLKQMGPVTKDSMKVLLGGIARDIACMVSQVDQLEQVSIGEPITRQHLLNYLNRSIGSASIHIDSKT